MGAVCYARQSGFQHFQAEAAVIGIMENRLEATNIGIMEKKMETTIVI